MNLRTSEPGNIRKQTISRPQNIYLMHIDIKYTYVYTYTNTYTLHGPGMGGRVGGRRPGGRAGAQIRYMYLYIIADRGFCDSNLGSNLGSPTNLPRGEVSRYPVRFTCFDSVRFGSIRFNHASFPLARSVRFK